MVILGIRKQESMAILWFIGVILRLAVLIQYRSVTDTQTDTQTHEDGIYRASIASRGKNYNTDSTDSNAVRMNNERTLFCVLYASVVSIYPHMSQPLGI